jgi:mannose-6-phosphate isomerase-like protein (cupin superfamily)
LWAENGDPGSIISLTEVSDMTMKVVNVRDAFEFSPEKMKKVSLFDTDNFFCDIYCLEPGQFQKVHSHEGSDKVYYVLEGQGKVTVGTEEKVLSQNEMTMAPSGEDHGVVNHTDDKLVMLVFMAPKPA